MRQIKHTKEDEITNTDFTRLTLAGIGSSGALSYVGAKVRLHITAGHTQLPGRGVANVGSFAYLVGNPTRKRSEAATAHTGKR